MKSEKSYYLCVKNKSLKIVQYNKFTKVVKQMDTIFLNSKNSGTSQTITQSHRFSKLKEK